MERADRLSYMIALTQSRFSTRRQKFKAQLYLVEQQAPISDLSKWQRQRKLLPNVTRMEYHFERRGCWLSSHYATLRRHSQSLEDFMNGKCLSYVDNTGCVGKTGLSVEQIEQFVFRDRNYFYQLTRVGNRMLIASYRRSFITPPPR